MLFKNKITPKKISFVFLTIIPMCCILFLPSVRLLIISFAERFIVHRQLTTEYWMNWLLHFSYMSIIVCAYLFFFLFFYNQIANFLSNHNEFFIFGILFFFLLSNLNIIFKGNFYGYNNIWDFRDFTDSIRGYGVVENLYSTNYPPLAVLLFKFLLKFLPTDVNLSDTAAINYCLSMYVLFTTISIFILICKYLNSIRNKELFAFVIILCSGPFLFAFQRMNIIHIALIFTMIFVMYHNSENKKLREFALFSLAIAANIKYYPAIFGLILIKEKHWKECVRCMIYGILLYVLPMFFSKNIAVACNPQYIAFSPIDGLISFLNANTDYYSISFRDTMYRLFFSLHLITSYLKIYPFIFYLYIALSVFCFFVTKNKYQSYIFLSLLCIFLPSTSFWYVLVFLLIPLLEFLVNRENKLYDNIIFLLFILIFGFVYGYATFLQPHHSGHILVMFVISAIDCLYNFFKDDGIRSVVKK